jgi:McbB family protein|nr:McbB family protein [Heyndrickxia oleronia]
MGDNIQYSINNYILYELETDSDIIIQHQYGIVRVKEPTMKKLLQLWENKGTTTVDSETFRMYFGENSTEAIDFLSNNQIIRTQEKNPIEIKNINIICDDKFIQRLLIDILTKDFSKHFKVNFHSIDDLRSGLISNANNEFLLAFLHPYSKKIGLELRDRQKSNDSSVSLISYIYANNFYIDSLYSANWIVPCHGCNIGHIESQLYVGESDSVTYQQLIDSLYTESNDFKVEIPLTNIQRINIVRLLVNRMYKYINTLQLATLHPTEVTNTTMMDLNNFKVYEDTSIFWEMCNCYE